jgi:hypothetical protein
MPAAVRVSTSSTGSRVNRTLFFSACRSVLMV